MGDFNACVDEIKSTGILGCAGISQIDWGGNACYECWKCSPCCGAPDPMNCVLCILHWYFLSPCSNCKLYATSLDQPCAIFPHCLFGCYCAPYAALFTRYNLRRKAGGKGNMVGDWVCLYCCGPCACCQNLRSVQIAGWRLFPELQVPVPISDNLIFIK